MIKPSAFLSAMIWVIWWLPCLNTQAQRATSVTDSLSHVNKKEQPRPLFTSDSIEVFTLTTDVRALLRDRSETAPPIPATLTFTDATHRTSYLPLTLKVRGNFRRKRVNCLFPPLLIDFPKKAVRHTPFAHQHKLKLVTHCQVDEWVVRELLVYKIYNLITDLSFRVQLARITYADSLGKRTPETHWAFLLEDDDDLAKRNRAKISSISKTTMRYVDSLQMATVAVFAFMIGNTDWSIPYLHNIRLFDNNEQWPLPVPYDFDHAGIVDANYARPAEQLGIESVRERVYRGLVYSMPVFNRVFDLFNRAKPAIYALYQTDSRLDKTYVKRTLKYLDEFYALIGKPSIAVARFANDIR